MLFFFFPRKLILFRGKEVEGRTSGGNPILQLLWVLKSRRNICQSSEGTGFWEGMLGDRASRGFRMMQERNLDTPLELVDSGKGSTKSQTHKINIYGNLTLWEQEEPSEFTPWESQGSKHKPVKTRTLNQRFSTRGGFALLPPQGGIWHRLETALVVTTEGWALLASNG